MLVVVDWTAASVACTVGGVTIMMLELSLQTPETSDSICFGTPWSPAAFVQEPPHMGSIDVHTQAPEATAATPELQGK